MIYFVTAREVGRVKIGYSAAPKGRFVKMRTDSPVSLVMERVCDGDKLAEREIHQRFNVSRADGEWFHLTPEIEAFMATLEHPRPVAKKRSVQWKIVEATGCSRSHASQIVSPKYPQNFTIPIALAVWEKFGELHGPLVGATDQEIATLLKFCGRFQRKVAA